MFLSVLLLHSNFITMTSQWARWRLKSPASPLFTQAFIRAIIMKTSMLRVTGLCEGNSPGTDVSISWHHNLKCCTRDLNTNDSLPFTSKFHHDQRSNCVTPSTGPESTDTVHWSFNEGKFQKSLHETICSAIKLVVIWSVFWMIRWKRNTKYNDTSLLW